MNRNSLMEISGRAMHTVQRMTLNKPSDDPMMQELDFDGMNSEGRQKVERVQAFGYTATPLPRDEDEQKGGLDQQPGKSEGGGGGVGGDGEKPKGPAAEGIALYVGGQRNHPVVIALDDRRHRPMGLKPGESAQYDDIGQMTLLRRNGTFVLSLDSEEKPSKADSGTKPGQHAEAPKGKMVERMVSIRHVEKKKQERQQSKPSGDQGGGVKAGTQAAAGQSQSSSQKDYKHEGETVNTEVRLTKNRIEFRVGDEVVGYYDKGAKRWSFTGEVKLGADDAKHPVYGVGDAGTGMTTKKTGEGAVLVTAPEPGPPTSLDTEP